MAAANKCSYSPENSDYNLDSNNNVKIDNKNNISKKISNQKSIQQKYDFYTFDQLSNSNSNYVQNENSIELKPEITNPNITNQSSISHFNSVNDSIDTEKVIKVDENVNDCMIANNILDKNINNNLLKYSKDDNLLENTLNSDNLNNFGKKKLSTYEPKYRSNNKVLSSGSFNYNTNNNFNNLNIENEQDILEKNSNNLTYKSIKSSKSFKKIEPFDLANLNEPRKKLSVLKQDSRSALITNDLHSRKKNIVESDGVSKIKLKDVPGNSISSNSSPSPSSPSPSSIAANVVLNTLQSKASITYSNKPRFNSCASSKQSIDSPPTLYAANLKSLSNLSPTSSLSSAFFFNINSEMRTPDRFNFLPNSKSFNEEACSLEENSPLVIKSENITDDSIKPTASPTPTIVSSYSNNNNESSDAIEVVNFTSSDKLILNEPILPDDEVNYKKMENSKSKRSAFTWVGR